MESPQTFSVPKQRYFSKVAGSKFIFPDGEVIFFQHGFFEFDPANYPGPIIIMAVNGQAADKRDGRPKAEVYYEELETLAKSNPLIYKQGGQPEATPKPRDSKGREGVDRNAASENELAMQDAQMRNAASGGVRITGDENKGSTLNVTDSTVDEDLKGMVLATRQTQQPNDRAAAAAARQAAASGAASHAASPTKPA